MKVAVVLFVSFAVLQSQFKIAIAKAIEDVSSDDDSSSGEELTDKEHACVDELHLDKQLITELNNEDIAPENNDQFNQFLACYWQKEEWMDSDGDVKYSKLLDSLLDLAEDDLEDEDPEVKTIVTKNIKESIGYCENNPPPKGSNNGQTAVRIQNCIMKKLNELFPEMGLSSEEDSSDLSSKEENCVNELQLDKLRIIKYNNREVAPEDNEEFNKFLACYWMKEEWMDSNGEINYDNLLFSLRAMAAIAYQGEPHEVKSTMKKRITRAIAYCQENSTKGENNGQTAAKLQNCITGRLSKGFYA